MSFFKSAIGAALTLLAGVLSLVLVVYDKLTQWRERRAAAAHEAKFKKEIKKIHDLVDEQRDMVLKVKREQLELEERKQKARDPVDLANDIIREQKNAKR